jgi:CRISPR/Cas system Type II protein with McrA/HNH and RuvC-like nuclease domain
VLQGLQVQTSLPATNESSLGEVLLKVCKGPCGLDKSTLEFGIRKDKKGREVDHIQPISKGGAHSKENVVPACKSCNSRKGAKNPSLFEFVISPKPISHKFNAKNGA